eukprot:gene4946-21289_t
MSGKRFELLDVPDHFDRCQTDREIDWNLCFLCQGVDQTALVCPANVTRADASQGYLAVIENLRRFEEIGQLPSSLKRSLVRMILGVSVIGGEPCELSNSRAATSISQLIRFNTIRKEKKHNGIVEKIRHMKADETPFPLYIGLMIHSKTRKKGLVVNLAKHGIRVPYNRVQIFELAVTKQLCKIYRENGVVCPPSIQNGMFTSAAIDNIDHNPSSSTALSAFHGTSISIFQHPKIMRGQTQLQLENDIEKSSVPLELPSYYTEICPTKSKIPEYPLQRTNTEDYSNNAQKLLEDNGWLQNLHCWESSELNCNNPTDGIILTMLLN